MSNHSENIKKEALAKLELTLREQQMKMQLKDKSIQYAMQTTQPKESMVVGAGGNSKPSITPEDILDNAKKYYEFITNDL